MEDEAKKEAAAPQPAPGPAKEEAKPAQAAPAHDAPKADAPKSENEQRILAALSYVGILFLVPMLFAKESEFCKYHVRQGIVLFAVEVVLSFGFLNRMLGGLVSLAIGIISLYCILRTLQGAKWELPLLGKYAQKIRL